MYSYNNFMVRTRVSKMTHLKNIVLNSIATSSGNLLLRQIDAPKSKYYDEYVCYETEPADSTDDCQNCHSDPEYDIRSHLQEVKHIFDMLGYETIVSPVNHIHGRDCFHNLSEDSDYVYYRLMCKVVVDPCIFFLIE